MDVSFVDEDEQFTRKQLQNLESYLALAPSILAPSLIIHRYRSRNDAFFADSLMKGENAHIRIFDKFYTLDDEDQRFVFLHELGHSYFHSHDELDDIRETISRLTDCEKKNVDYLLRAQWMELGEWDLDPIALDQLRMMNPENLMYRDRYTYITATLEASRMCSEWICPEQNKIVQDRYELAFRYSKNLYSPIEEMADAYAFFILDKPCFETNALENEGIMKKYEFIEKQLSPQIQSLS